MFDDLGGFFIHWAITAFSMWVASRVFSGMRFSGAGAVLWSALLLGLANAVLRPLLIFLTLPLTFLTLGFFLLVINALMLQLVARFVSGFRLDGFWTAFFASLFISLLSLLLMALVPDGGMTIYRLPVQGGSAVWI